jgi:hypothetical protein
MNTGSDLRFLNYDRVVWNGFDKDNASEIPQAF